jgi:hypothetical protein
MINDSAGHSIFNSKVDISEEVNKNFDNLISLI